MRQRMPLFLGVLLAALLIPGCGGNGGGSSAPIANDLDRDGVIDSRDAFPNDAAASVDTDGDGFPNSFNALATAGQLASTRLKLDAFPQDPAAAVDTDKDGLLDAWNPGATPAQIAASLLVLDTDDDNDGVPDATDALPQNPTETVDTDGDGIGNNADIDDDNDGFTDGLDDFPLDPTEWEDTDADGIGDNADPDDDNDGILDAADPFPLVAFLNADSAPEPVNLGLFLKNTGQLVNGFPAVDPAAKAAAIALGKALYWDMNVGSDGIQSCATCHFQAGADNRTRNQVNPGLLAGDSAFQVKQPNQPLTAGDFPLHQRINPLDQASATLRDSNDVVASMGVYHTMFDDIILGGSADSALAVLDPIFRLGGQNTRRVEPRQSPSVINAVFNFTNFWDGRARNIFNGTSPFGELDQASGVFVQNGGVIQAEREVVRIPDASLASQAVGPPMSDFEMSAMGRTFPKLGKKLLYAGLKPLSQQVVAGTDSVLGGLADTPTGLAQITPGENAYVSLIKQAFQPKYWDSPNQHVVFNGAVPTLVSSPVAPNNTSQFTQMEANFSLFFGLAIQLYEATLVSDESRFDLVQQGLATFTTEELDGFNTFFGAGNCNFCHGGSLFTVHTVPFLRGVLPPQPAGFLPADAVEGMPMAQGIALYDAGIYNIGVTRTPDDLSRGGDSPFLNPETGQLFPLSHTRLGLLKQQAKLPLDVATFVPSAPVGLTNRAAVDGAFKTPGLRNVELTGPYFHNGSASTLQQVVEFYARGGNFPLANIENLDPIGAIGKLKSDPVARNNLVKFLLTLTDDRVKYERGPFDHPSLRIPSGDGVAGGPETLIDIPAVGAAGNAQPLEPFLGLDPLQP